MRYLLPLLFLALLASQSVYAGTTGVLAGKVNDDNGKPIIGAVVRLLPAGSGGGVSKAPDGSFTIAGIRAGDYQVEISSIGYTKVTRSVRITVDQTTNLGTVQLASSALQGQHVVVTDTRIIQPERVGTVRSVSPDGYDRVTRTRSVNAVAVPQPVTSSGVNGFSIRGGRATESSITASRAVVNGGSGSRPGEYDNSQGSDVNGSSPVRDAEEQGRDSYAAIPENQFLPTSFSPISTFSIDVDAASYSNIRRYLGAGQQPPPDAVRIEEMINYFPYNTAAPTGETPFALTTEISDAPWNRRNRLVMIAMRSASIPVADLPPNNLVFLVDVSGSMTSPDKLPLVKAGLRLLVAQMREQDTIALVVYAGSAGLVLPRTSGAHKDSILDAIDRLEGGGSTNGGAGIELAYATALQGYSPTSNNRVILATDGDFNVGVSNKEKLVEMIEEKRSDGIFLTVLGFGRGNLQDDMMEQLANKGNGNYAYIDDIAEARKVLVNELGATLLTVAKDVKLQVIFNPAEVASYRLIGYENRMLRTEDFDDDLKDAGELGAGHGVTAFYEIVPVAGGERRGQSNPYNDTLDMPAWGEHGDLMRVRARYKLPTDSVSLLIEQGVSTRAGRIEKSSDDFRFAAAVAGLGLMLRGSQFKGTTTIEQILMLAEGALGSDPGGYRAEFIRMVRQMKIDN